MSFGHPMPRAVVDIECRKHFHAVIMSTQKEKYNFQKKRDVLEQTERKHCKRFQIDMTFDDLLILLLL